MSYQTTEKELPAFRESSSVHWIQTGEVMDLWVASGSYSVKATPQTLDIIYSDAVKFNQLAEKWRTERGITSSTTAMILCRSYQAIIGMGPLAVDLILQRLRAEGNNPDHWFWALQILTGENPVSEEDEGNLRKMADAWLRWAEGR
jgi:hypothetical protein